MNKYHRAALPDPNDERDISPKWLQARLREAADEIDRLQAELERCREALRFYANEENYKSHLQGEHDNPELVCPVAEDGGEVAQHALRGKRDEA